MKETTKIYKSALIYSIGSFTTRIINFLIFPLYSYYLTSSEYGDYDLIISTFALILPLLTLQIPESIMKFISFESRDKVFSTSLFLALIVSVFSTIIGFFISLNYNLDMSIIFWLVIQMVNLYFLQIVRALGNNRVYSLSSILQTIIFILLVLTFLIYFELGLYSMVYAGIFSGIINSVFLLFHSKIFKWLKLKNFSIKLLIRMLKFSIPLIPTAMIWWIMNSSDKYIINIFLGSSYNGIYAISYKFPTIITIIYGLYNLAWQDYILLENKKVDIEPIIKQFINFLFFLSLMVMFFAKIVTIYYVNVSFLNSYLYIPPLIVGMIFYCFSGFLGIAYRKKDNTRAEFKSSFIGAIINIVINILLINVIGLWSASISTMFSFIFVSYIRYKDTYNFFQYKISLVKVIEYLVIFIVFVTLYYSKNIIVIFGSFIVTVILFLYKNKDLLHDFKLIFVKK